MPLSADQFAQALVKAGLSSADELKTLWASLPAGGKPKDGTTFAGLLVERGKLTRFQADELLSGGGTPLVLGDYVLLAKIGAGGMGQVFQAQHRHMKRRVAIKLLPAALTKDEAAIKRFQREVEAAAKLSHPNIVQAHDASVQRGVWYLVMEFVDGRDLADIVAAEGPLPIARAVDMIRQAAQGLAFAHDNGVVHRDVKPANLLLDRKGVVKILDLGLARFDDQAAAQAGLTQSGMVMGTVDFMAPEQAFDTHTADARADIYSLGCTLFRLLTDRNMYDGDTLVKKLMAHQTKPIPALGDVRPEAPAELTAIFERMVAKKPEDRYQTMAEVEGALESLGRSLGIAPPSGSTSGGRKTKTIEPEVTAPMKSRPVSTKAQDIAATVALQNPLQATDPVSDESIQIARKNSDVALRISRRNRPALIAGGVGALLLLAVFGGWLVLRDPVGGEVAREKAPEREVAIAPANAPSTTSAADGTIDYAVEREAAEILIRDWNLTLRFNSGPNRYILRDSELPPEEFTVVVIVFPVHEVPANYPATFLSAIAKLRRLEHILSQPRWGFGLTEAEFAKLGDMPLAATLSELQLNSHLVAANMPTLKKMSRLKSLHLMGENTDDQTVAQLADLSNLRSLILDRFATVEQRVTERGWKALAQLPLEHLGLDHDREYVRPRSDQFSYFAAMPNLTSFSLSTAEIREEELNDLAKCRWLKRLELAWTRTSRAELLTFHRERPEVELLRHGKPVFPEVAKIEKTSPAVDETVDLLPLLVPETHCRSGKWIKEDGAWLSPDLEGYWLKSVELPIEPANSYRMEVVAERLTEKGCLCLALTVGEAESLLTFDGYQETLSGLEDIRRKNLSQQTTPYNQPLLAVGKPAKIVIEVSPGKVFAKCDGKIVADWTGESRDLSIYDMIVTECESHSLVLLTADSQFRISKLTYTALAD